MNTRAAAKHSDFVRLMVDDGPEIPAQEPRTLGILEQTGQYSYRYSWSVIPTSIRWVSITGTVNI